MEGNASVYQVNRVSRISGDGRAVFLGHKGLFLIKMGAGGGKGGEGTGGTSQFVYKVLRRLGSGVRIPRSY